MDMKEVVIDEVAADGLVYCLISRHGSREYGDTLVISRQAADGSRRLVYEKDFADLRPWKLEMADVDGDRNKEILIAVYKATHFDQQEKNRLFVFRFDAGKLTKKWTGSQIAGTWHFFFAGDLLPIPGDELLFIEQTQDNKERISMYYWFEFGFAFLAASEAYDDIKDIAIIGENRMSVKRAAGGKEEVRTMMVKSGKIIEAIPN